MQEVSIMNPAPSIRHRMTLAGATVLALSLAATTTALAQGASITVEPAALENGATTLTVTGSGFDPAGNGVYVVFGPITPAPTYYSDPSIYGAFKWVHAGANESPAEAPLAADGSFTTTLDVMSAFTASGEVDCAATVCAVITFAAHGSPDRSQDTCVPLLVGGIASSAASPGPEASAASELGSLAVDPCAPITGEAPVASGAPAGSPAPSAAASVAP